MAVPTTVLATLSPLLSLSDSILHYLSVAFLICSVILFHLIICFIVVAHVSSILNALTVVGSLFDPLISILADVYKVYRMGFPPYVFPHHDVDTPAALTRNFKPNLSDFLLPVPSSQLNPPHSHTDCAICFEPVKSSDLVFPLPCCHTYHQ
eukprot:GFKZ01015645.1.p1 GENE.GFKZ01015645.1~~GFKZ01015645.1.p1  ORF type:complete len:151 (-),score=10.11 GFKZ01015645.1:195-647(-)